jgi:hypothetical protein
VTDAWSGGVGLVGVVQFEILEVLTDGQEGVDEAAASD